ncbi:sporulation protein [Brevundimonas sp. AAP58]|uniref:SPOR domain-containing protein n=1 Tax=Brevundimonas sp. AAP58 TaxID=1523422 RepID=UPI0006B8ABCC|nr:SPOR domain-containing protein [Brevundimonas sp. AAP58]KPF83875.1 sporulation protein [Brevundimonas sp. AAP58]
MSYDDDNRPRDRGAYTPPTDDDLPFNRGGYDPRRAPPRKAPPVTLLVSAGVLLVLIIAVVLFYRSGLRSSTDAPPAVGTPVAQMKVEAPIEAQPIDPEADVGLYDEVPETTAAPEFAPPPETPLPRPVPRPIETAEKAEPVRPTAPATRPAAVQTPAPVADGAGGSAAVQIGAFSSTAIADREYAAVAARFPQFARNATKRVQEVTASNGSTVYRTTFTGLSAADARAFCAAIQAGGGDCLVR